MNLRRFATAMAQLCIPLGVLTYTLCNLSIAVDDFELRTVANSTTGSKVFAVNSSLAVVGSREITKGPIRSNQAFYRKGEKDVDLSVPKDFTNLEAYALSDNGLVVGYVSRPMGDPRGSLRGFVWDCRTKMTTLLDPIGEDIISHAQDISADGTVITGYSTGTTAPGTRPCVWEWNSVDQKWVGQALSTVLAHNPFIQSGCVLVSPDGKQIAASITERQFSSFNFDSSLFVWKKAENGDWVRSKISDEQPKLKDMNNAGTIVGTINVNEMVRAASIDLNGKVDLIELLEGNDTSEANGINNAGVIVGMSDSHAGQEGGPRAFISTKGKTEPLSLSETTLISSALAINQDGAIVGFSIPDTGDDAIASGFIRIPKKQLD